MANTTTIRVKTGTRDKLNALAAKRGAPASEVVAELVEDAAEELLLSEMAAGFERMAADPAALSAYRAEARAVESDFEAPAPEW